MVRHEKMPGVCPKSWGRLRVVARQHIPRAYRKRPYQLSKQLLPQHDTGCVITSRGRNSLDKMDALFEGMFLTPEANTDPAKLSSTFLLATEMTHNTVLVTLKNHLLHFILVFLNWQNWDSEHNGVGCLGLVRDSELWISGNPR